MNREVLVRGVLAAFLVLSAGCSGSGAVALDPPRPAPEIEGIDWNGSPFRLSDRRGRVVAVTFGYTHCPDVCPTTLSTLRQAVAGKEGVEVVFVTVDPERDTRERLAAYVPAFDRRFHAPTLDEAVAARVLEGFEVVARRQEPASRREPGPPRYAIDHTSGVFFVDRAGVIRSRLPADAKPEAVARELERLGEEGR